jgi:monoamine oxidase
VDSARTQRIMVEGRLRAIDAFAEARKAMRNAAALKAKDVSFATFLSRSRGLSQRTRSFARMMVEGFDAADPSRASARAIVEEWCASPQLGAQFRPLGGYSALLDCLGRSAVQLQSVVREIRWQPGSLEVRGERLGTPFSYRAPKAIVTLPLGVLQSGAVRFIPALKEKQRALAKLAAGPVVKIAVRFGAAFWEQHHPEVAFFHSPAAAFPTFWTPLPMRAAFLIGWAGGPKAQRVRPSNCLQLALQSLKSIFGELPRFEAVYWHDWQDDPYARGAYSYVKVGGEGAREELQAPLADTLYFAGEATDTDGEAGTVAGALQSGMRSTRNL